MDDLERAEELAWNITHSPLIDHERLVLDAFAAIRAEQRLADADRIRRYVLDHEGPRTAEEMAAAIRTTSEG